MFYLFHHIPKTAGTSVRVALSRIFRVVEDYHTSTSPDVISAFMRDRTDLSRLVETDVLCGHWNIHGTRLWERYPDLHTFAVRKFMFLRPPLETAMSGARFNIETGTIAGRTPDDLLLSRVGYIAYTLGCTSENYRDVVDSYWHVGLTSRIQDSLDHIANAAGAEPVVVQHHNVTDVAAFEFSDSAISQFMERSVLDLAIFDYATSVANIDYAMMDHAASKV